VYLYVCIRAGLAPISPSNPIAAFSGAGFLNSALSGASPLISAPKRLPSSTANEATLQSEETVGRRLSRVATKVHKHNGNASPQYAPRTRSSGSRADESMHLEDLNEADEPSAQSADKKKHKVLCHFVCRVLCIPLRFYVRCCFFFNPLILVDCVTGRCNTLQHAATYMNWWMWDKLFFVNPCRLDHISTLAHSVRVCGTVRVCGVLILMTEDTQEAAVAQADETTVTKDAGLKGDESFHSIESGEDEIISGDMFVTDTKGGDAVRKRKEGGKKLGWGDKKAPPLGFKPWYQLW